MNIPFDNPLFLIPAMTGLIMLEFPPKDINSFYGYRTNNSMKNKERWTFAQEYSAIQMTKLGGLLTLSGLLGFFFNLKEKAGTLIGLGLMTITVIILFFRVENAIKKRLNKEK